MEPEYDVLSLFPIPLQLAFNTFVRDDLGSEKNLTRLRLS